MINWDDFRYILAIYRKGTLSGAAETLGVNQTTVTRRLKSLQRELGVQLFDKLHQGVFPTQAGEDMVTIAEEMEQKVFQVDDNIAGKDRDLRGPLRVTFPEIIGGHWQWAFHEFCQRYPKIELELSLSNQQKNLTQREADVAIRIGVLPPEHLIGRKLVKVKYALYGSNQLIKKLGSTLSYDEYPWLAYERKMGAKVTEKWMFKHARKAKIICYVNTLQLLHEGIRSGMGIQFLPCIIGDNDPLLKRLRPVEEGFSGDLWLLSHPNLRHIARVKTFMDFIAEIFIDHKGQFAGLVDNPCDKV
ncbi:LysR family transcriptional regulator [Shewanella surugensis]|uniref:LysR family transcriptional regulator n=1 Tax=Shewanella surugensis TaxID=212020 RepID=A0ABT0LIA0_9GAMM|nr:LysR family transcriptional regulator [Shewanella surugensis]MCL1127438.1 LysR family transcriptional regulator [Shewanella surugensis]